MARKYGWDAEYTYNTFGANECYEVTLYRLNKKGTHWKEVQTWAYSTFMNEKVAHSRAKRRIRKLKKVYGAKRI